VVTRRARQAAEAPPRADGEVPGGARLNRRHWLVFAVCVAGAFFDSMDLQVMALVSPVLLREWALTPTTVGVLAAAAMLGMLVGSLVFGRVADRIGRRPAFLVTVAVFAGFGALCAAAQGPAQLTVLRFCVGVGMGGFIPVDTAMLHEFLPAGARARLLALWALAFPVGALAATALVRSALPATGWRGAFLLCALPAVLLFPLRRLVPETPAFLLAQGRTAEAERSLGWISLGAPVRVDPPAPRLRPTLLSALHRSTTALTGLLWFTWSFAYFGVILWLPTLLVLAGMPLAQVFAYTLGFQVAAILGRVAMLPVIRVVGLPAVVVGTGIGAAALVLWFGALPAAGLLVVAGYGLSFCQEGGFSGIVPFTPQLYPVELRSGGVGAANAAGRVASLLAPLLVGVLTTAGQRHVVFVVFALCFLAAGVTALALRGHRGPA